MIRRMHLYDYFLCNSLSMFQKYTGIIHFIHLFYLYLAGSFYLW